ncbi:hypothetical protein Tco_0608756 [Tanacetum coccineum]
MNGISVDTRIANQHGIGNVVTARAEGKSNGSNDNQIRCVNGYEEGHHHASTCIVKPKKMDVAYLQKHIQIAQKEEAGIQVTQEEFDFMADACASEETKRVQTNCTSEDTLQQASTSRTQPDNAPVYDSDGLTEVPNDETCCVNDILNMLPFNVQSTDLQTELDHMKEKLETCIIKKEKEYVVLWNNWYTKCEECKYDKISYDKAYTDMQTKIEWLQAQLGDLKGKSSNSQCASNTLDPVSQKHEDEKVSLEFQVQNYAKENEHLKTTYRNLLDSITVTQHQTKSIINSLRKQLYDTIYENTKLRAQLFDKVSEQKDTTKGTRTDTKFTKQSILGKPPSSSKPKLSLVTPFPKFTVLPKKDESNALLKPFNSNSAPPPRESKFVQTIKVIASRIFRTNHSKTFRVDNVVPNKPVNSSVRTKPITTSQLNVIHKQHANSDSNGFSPTSVINTAKTRRPLPVRIHSKSNSSFLSNNFGKIEENHRNLPIPKTKKHKSSKCNNIKLAIRNAKSKVVCAMCNRYDSYDVNDKSWKVYSVICSTNYSNGENQVVSKSSSVTTADESDKRQQQQDSTSSTSTLATTISAGGIFDL